MSIPPKDHHKHTVKHKNTVTQIKQRCKVAASKLKKYTDDTVLPPSTELAPAAQLDLGQKRAVHAIKTAFDISATGYHVFAVGENGLGKRTFITRYLQQQGKPQAPLCDWIYVYNFHSPSHPVAIALPAKTAQTLQQQLLTLWQTLTHKLNTAKQSYEQIAKQTLAPLYQALMTAHADNAKLLDYLHRMQEDMIAHADLIAAAQDERFVAHHQRAIPDRYDINIMVNHANMIRRASVHHTPDAAAIIFEPYPKLTNLLGYVGQSLQAGSSVSNHMMIQPGALHHANGGYLLIEAHHLAAHLDAWQALKRTLQSRHLILSNDQPPLTGTDLQPEPIPLNLKVILLGDPDLYDQFAERDVEFNTTFKIRADFHDEISRTADNEVAMSSKMADIAAKYDLKPFDNTAQAVALEYLSLQCEDQNKLSLHTDSLIQLMLEANRHAHTAQAALVSAEHIKHALADMAYRSGYLKELYLQEITDGQQLISTTGKAVGQINALTIVDYADSEFGMPALLTAVVQHSVGSGDILDIERDVELGGSLHAKGMLIMNSYLRALFSPYHPLNFTASLAFEQSYAHIDGDSATLAEACALLSALADVPIAQSLAITGSMNQLGRVQAVGGINAKVAGFFDACSHQGLSGQQGVILPYANISQLMLRDDIIAAVKAKKFHIYGVKTLSEALTILSDIAVDTTTKKGRYRKSSLFGKIIKNLKKWEEQLNPPEEDDTQGDNDASDADDTGSKK